MSMGHENINGESNAFVSRKKNSPATLTTLLPSVVSFPSVFIFIFFSIVISFLFSCHPRLSPLVVVLEAPGSANLGDPYGFRRIWKRMSKGGCDKARMEAAGLRRRNSAHSGSSNRWKSLKRRLGCCGSSWAAFLGSSPDHWVREDEMVRGARAAAGVETEIMEGVRTGDPGCDGEIHTPASPEAMNLATALAAERQFRAVSAHTPPRRGQLNEGNHRWEGEGDGGTATTVRASLMRLLAEGGSGGAAEVEEAWWCCVCLGRRRGAAFIPCGHTLCRVCSREVWLNRGACPLCNRPILDVLDIF